MIRLLKAFRYKLFRDLTFRITLIIGAGLAVMMTLVYLLMEHTATSEIPFKICTGQSLLVLATNPAEGFGYSVPINLCTFIVLEFTSGTIRNKIIAGNSQFKIYASLFISGLIFAILLMGMYIALTFGLGCAIGGFNPEGLAYTMMGGGQLVAGFVPKLLVITLVSYLTITSIAVFAATLFRNIGPCIPVVIVFIMIFALVPMMVGMAPGMEKFMEVSSYINPLHSLVCFTSNVVGETPETMKTYISIDNMAFLRSIICNLVYTSIFFALGARLFVKRDVK